MTNGLILAPGIPLVGTMLRATHSILSAVR